MPAEQRVEPRRPPAGHEALVVPAHLGAALGEDGRRPPAVVDHRRAAAGREPRADVAAAPRPPLRVRPERAVPAAPVRAGRAEAGAVRDPARRRHGVAVHGPRGLARERARPRDEPPHERRVPDRRRLRRVAAEAHVEDVVDLRLLLRPQEHLEAAQPRGEARVDQEAGPDRVLAPPERAVVEEGRQVHAVRGPPRRLDARGF
mmetsp:Transcript_8230/g.28172  ORF Transcript_8230/g.28172 Transcript_8230/m.28172 type:complete len:203 (+) Transcript_8230:504-1112(+)